MVRAFRILLAIAPRLLLWFTATAVLSPTAGLAQAYRWVDANGKTHFSDQAPAQDSIHYETIEAAPENDTRQSKIPAESVSGHTDFAGASIVVTQVELPWRTNAKQKSSVGRYYFGKACASATAMVLPIALQQHPGLFPAASFIGSEIAHALRQQNLSAYWDDLIATDDANQWPDALRLRVRLSSLSFDTCAPAESRTFVQFNLGDIPARKFRRHRLQFDVEWSLLTARGAEIYRTSTSGILDRWSQSLRADNAYREALRGASRQLLDQPGFKSALLQHKPELTGVDPHEEKNLAITDSSPWRALLDKTSAYLGFYRQSQLSQTLALLPQIKTRITEFYMHEGYWPGDLSQINLQEAGLVNNTEGLQRVYLEANGAILFKLDDKFGHDSRLIITPLPDPGNNMIYWRCKTNISASFVPRSMNCKQESHSS